MFPLLYCFCLCFSIQFDYRFSNFSFANIFILLIKFDLIRLQTILVSKWKMWIYFFFLSDYVHEIFSMPKEKNKHFLTLHSLLMWKLFLFSKLSYFPIIFCFVFIDCDFLSSDLVFLLQILLCCCFLSVGCNILFYYFCFAVVWGILVSSSNELNHDKSTSRVWYGLQLKYPKKRKNEKSMNINQAQN